MAAEKRDDFEIWFERLGDGSLIDFLRHDRFPAWVELVSRDFPDRELGRFAPSLAGAADQARKDFQGAQVEALARRLLLSQNAVLLEHLRPLWRAFGISDKTCDDAIEGIDRAVKNWSATVVHERDVSVGGFSGAHGDFVESMLAIAALDSGVLGGAIRNSRIVHERRHVGFPVVVGPNVKSTLRASLWVEPTPASSVVVKKPAGRWSDVWERVVEAIGDNFARTAQCPLLPDWFLSFRAFAKCDDKTLDSAGLALAMQLVADAQERSLPFGIGFTGRWEGGELRGVTDIQLKQQAAAEAGVFLLFACRDRDASEPMPEPVRGVRLVLLDEHLSLAAVIRQVNRVCAECGLTECRWRRESKPIDSRDLPNASGNYACPVGVKGGNEELERLHEWHDRAHRTGQRQIHAVVGAPRTGKTTLLSKWANDKNEFPFFPAWFSFRRGFAPRSEKQQMERAIAAQVDARFAVLRLPAHTQPANAAEQLRHAIEATEAPIDIFIDGVDEALPDERIRIVHYLQSIPAGKGLLVVGTQPIEGLECIQHRIDMNTNGGAKRQAVLQLLDSWAARFEQRGWVGVARDLRNDRWRNYMVRESGSDLAVLTDSLRTVCKKTWPARPEGLRLAKGDAYYRGLLADIEKRDPEHFNLFNRFIAVRAFLDDGLWRVADVLRLMDVEDQDLMFTGDGPPTIRPWLKFTRQSGELCCRFESPSLQGFARDEFYMPLLSRVVKRAVKLLAPLDDLPCSNLTMLRSAAECYFGQRQIGPSDLADYIVRNLPGWIVSLTNDVRCSAKDLSRSTWLYRRLRAMAQDLEIDWLGGLVMAGVVLKKLHTIGKLPKPDKSAVNKMALADAAVAAGLLEGEIWPELPSQAGRAARLSEVLHELHMLNRSTTSSEFTEAINFLSTWGVPMTRDRRIDTWWDAAPALRQFQKCPEPPDTGGSNGPLLLAPLPNGYLADKPADSRLNGPACELHSEDRPLVLATRQGLMLFRKRNGRYQFDPPFRPLPEDERIGALASASDTEVAALIHAPPGPDELRIIDLTTFAHRTLLTAGDGESFESVYLASRERPVTLVLVMRRAERRAQCYDLRVYDVEGKPLSPAKAAMRLQFIRSSSNPIAVVPFAGATWAIVGQTGATSPSRLILQRLVERNGSWKIESFGPSIDQVNGACAIPGNRLAVTYRSGHESYLAVFDSSGELHAPKNCLYSTPRHAHDRYDLHHATIGEFLLECRPVAWHKGLGLLLATELDAEIWCISLGPESIRKPLPKVLAKEICPQTFSTVREFLTLRDGSVLLIVQSSALVAGPELNDAYWLFGSLKPDVHHEILGVRADGAVIAQEEAWLDQEGIPWQGAPSVELPPGINAPPDGPLSGLCRVTADGWEVAISPRGTSLAARHAGTNKCIRKRLRKGRISDICSNGDGGFVVATVDSDRLRIYCMSTDGRIRGHASCKVHGWPKLLAASRHLVVVEDSEEGREFYASYCFDLGRRRQIDRRRAQRDGHSRPLPAPRGDRVHLRQKLPLTESRRRRSADGELQHSRRAVRRRAKTRHSAHRHGGRKAGQKGFAAMSRNLPTIRL